MKVWIVSALLDGGDLILGVYDSKEKAEAARLEAKRTRPFVASEAWEVQ